MPETSAFFDALPDSTSLTALFLSVIVLWSTVTAFYSFYDAYYRPLSHYPGPRSRALSTIPKIWSDFWGRDCLDVPALHARYGPVVRTAPHELSYSNGKPEWREIY
ncbi:hypothetical protein Slin15195_G089780 [Septoria linicola]|uniref:Uncharacterized protein n=1 Tax=Septoria linicola TaxID=215465 RepID=A0A9Q9AVJ8_9PEZI|nr:hypothetical protein Slin15195_G089780 [Septoria linicola]